MFSSTVPEKPKRGNELARRGDLRPFGFSNIHSVAKYHKIERGPFGDIGKFLKKSHSPEKLKGGRFSLVLFWMLL